MAFMFFKEAVGVKAIADVKSYFTIHFIKCCMYVDNKLRDVFETHPKKKNKTPLDIHYKMHKAVLYYRYM